MVVAVVQFDKYSVGDLTAFVAVRFDIYFVVELMAVVEDLTAVVVVVVVRFDKYFAED
jgi:hypothetical protein